MSISVKGMLCLTRKRLASRQSRHQGAEYTRRPIPRVYVILGAAEFHRGISAGLIQKLLTECFVDWKALLGIFAKNPKRMFTGIADGF